MHHRQRALGPAGTAQPVRGVRQPVQVHAAGGESQHGYHQEPREQRGSAEQSGPATSDPRARSDTEAPISTP